MSEFMVVHKHNITSAFNVNTQVLELKFVAEDSKKKYAITRENATLIGQYYPVGGGKNDILITGLKCVRPGTVLTETGWSMPLNLFSGKAVWKIDCDFSIYVKIERTCILGIWSDWVLTIHP